MPLKIRCPHCQKVLRAEDDTAGEQKLCPVCHQVFTVPIPERAVIAPASADVARSCPRCGAALAPGAALCRQCHTDLVTGQRLPLWHRWRRRSATWWMAYGCAVACAALLLFVGGHALWVRLRRPAPAAQSFDRFHATPLAVEDWAARLLNAADGGERVTVRDKLAQAGATAAPQVAAAVAAALHRSLEENQGDWQTTRNQLAALALLARAAASEPRARARFGPLLESCEQRPALRMAAGQARALLGDMTALPLVRDVWIAELRHTLFLSRLLELTQAERDPGAARVLARARSRLSATADALHQLKQQDEAAVLDDLLTVFWESWDWLGQSRGGQVATALYEVAKPYGAGPAFPTGDSPAEPAAFEQQKTAIRGARDALDRVGARATALARAAAGLVLVQAAPQYHSARERIAEQLPALLPDCSPSDQQRVTWALARLTGRQFGRITPQSLPGQVERDDVEAALRWARQTQSRELHPLAAAADEYPLPPVLEYRVVLPARQLERDWLREFQRGWPESITALQQWLSAGLGCTPRVLTLLDPSQRAPSYPALAAAIVLAADCGGADAYRYLLLWRAAADQPLWLRQLAYTALAAIDARDGRWQTDWPAAFRLGPPDPRDGGQAGWYHFGEVLAAGGPALLERLQNFQPAPLPPETLVKLVAAAQDALRRRDREWNPPPRETADAPRAVP